MLTRPTSPSRSTISTTPARAAGASLPWVDAAGSRTPRRSTWCGNGRTRFRGRRGSGSSTSASTGPTSPGGRSAAPSAPPSSALGRPRPLDRVVTGQCLTALGGVVDDGGWIAVDLARLVDALGGNLAQLGHPAAHVGAVRVELASLQRRVEHPEVRRGVGPRARPPLPVLLVRRQVAVGQPLHEVSGAVSPPHVQVLHQEA